jgi:hypothetical protein
VTPDRSRARQPERQRRLRQRNKQRLGIDRTLLEGIEVVGMKL